MWSELLAEMENNIHNNVLISVFILILAAIKDYPACFKEDTKLYMYSLPVYSF